jgi:hypothetical protein
MPVTLPAISDRRKGYPLSYFAGTEPFAAWFHDSLSSSESQGDERERTPDSLPSANPLAWTEDVYLERFSSDEITSGPNTGAYEHILEFTTTREIAILLPEPKGVVALFGNYDKKKEEDDEPARLRLRFIVESKYGQLMQLDISGAIRFRLPQSLARPVVERERRWVDDPKHTHVLVPLGDSRLTLQRGLPPTLSSRLRAPDVTARIGETNVVANLTVARVDIAGTAARPKIQFKKIRLVYLTD